VSSSAFSHALYSPNTGSFESINKFKTMKMIKLSLLCAMAIVALTSTIYVSSKRPTQISNQNPATGKGFAVLELFTSEGCSSCPPADELMESIQKEMGEKPVYILAYHVDYWDRQGWKDVFGNAAFSKRQYWYNQKFTSQVYTPQLILNGTKEFVGSDELEIRKTLSSALNEKPATSLTLSAQQQAGDINIQYQLEGKPVHGQLVLAFVQKHAVSRVKAGENKGRTLTHAQIVRNLNTFPITQQVMEIKKISTPAGFDSSTWEVIGLIQNQNTGEILAAAKTAVSSSASNL
jgi:hypothetical protein